MLFLLTALMAIVFLSVILIPIEDDWEAYTRIVEKRFERDSELRDAHQRFVEEFGREPSHTELWMISPPAWKE